MQRWFSMSAVACVCATVALLAGCAGNGLSQLSPAGSAAGTNNRTMRVTHHVDLMQTLVTPRSVRPNLKRHVKDARIVRPNCCALQKTLFVSDAFGGSSFTGALYMFDYVTAVFLGQVAAPPEGFLEVQGGCSDNGGNVYFTNTGLSTIDEYNHSGTYVATISDPGQFPAGCSYDKATGNLAVSNIIDASGGPGSVSIFNGGVLQNTYIPPNMSRVYFLGYEGKTGTLWLTGSDSSGVFQYDSFSNGTFTSVGIHGATIGFPGMVQWSAQTNVMNVGDQDTFSAPTIYHVDDSGNVVGETVLTCEQPSDFCDLVQGVIKGPGIVGSDAVGLTVARYRYPAGGSPVLQYVVPSGYVEPIGGAISPDKE
jgi:hypothetical protein